VAARPNIQAIRQWLWARGRQVAQFAGRGYRAARREAAKDKYREYLSDAYGRMRQRYPKVESTAREALDAIGVKPAARKAVTTTAPARRKAASPKKTGAGRKKTAAKATRAVAKKKTGAKKTAGAGKKKKKKTNR
jgi:hypothetical protein